MSFGRDIKFGIEIYSVGYKSRLRLYRNGVNIVDSFIDEVNYINQKIATIVSRYREMCRYQLMSSSTYGGGWRVEFDANQVQAMGFSGVDRVYSNLDSLSILFSDELHYILEYLVKAYEFSVDCEDIYGVRLRYVEGSEYECWYDYWVELLDKAVNKLIDVLERFYVYYVGLLTNRDVLDYMLQRYDNGLVCGRYHNELDSGILHVTVDIELYRLRDVEVDVAHTCMIDRGEEYQCGYNVRFDSIMKNVYYLPLVTKDTAKGLCDVLEMIAYVNDAMLGYYIDNQMDLALGNLRQLDDYDTRYCQFLDVVSNRVDLPDYYEYGGIVFNYDDSNEVIEMFIPIGMLRKKVMASSVFDVSQFVVWYNTMLVECADRFKIC